MRLRLVVRQTFEREIGQISDKELTNFVDSECDRLLGKLVRYELFDGFFDIKGAAMAGLVISSMREIGLRHTFGC